VSLYIFIMFVVQTDHAVQLLPLIGGVGQDVLTPFKPHKPQDHQVCVTV